MAVSFLCCLFEKEEAHDGKLSREGRSGNAYGINGVAEEEGKKRRAWLNQCLAMAWQERRAVSLHL